jgi:hypothetical protein
MSWISLLIITVILSLVGWAIIFWVVHTVCGRFC